MNPANAAITIPIVAGIVQAIKQSGDLPSRLLPLAAIALGIVAAVLETLANAPHGTAAIPWAATITTGITWGLGASGLYAGGRHVVGTRKQKPPTRKWSDPAPQPWDGRLNIGEPVRPTPAPTPTPPPAAPSKGGFN